MKGTLLLLVSMMTHTQHLLCLNSSYSYVALYNYKPQKEDEVELRKGDYYTVSEKCQDGWFKGTCLRSGSFGVFPGNYVQLVK